MDKIKLYAPKEYWASSKEEIDAVTGGCGPGGFGDFLVPDTVWFLNIKIACRIHDFMYYIGETQEDKDIADAVFRTNMLRIIQAKTKNKILRRLRVSRALKYYWAVHTQGDVSYWANKNPTEEFREVVYEA